MTQVFHPGATEVGRAARVTVAAGEERGGTDIQLQYVPLATLTGTVTVEPGWNPAVMTIVRTDEVPGFDRVAEGERRRRRALHVPRRLPRQYRIMAQSTAASPLTTSGAPLIVAPGNVRWAAADVIVDGEDQENISLSLQPGLTIRAEWLSKASGRRRPWSLCACRSPRA